MSMQVGESGDDDDDVSDLGDEDPDDSNLLSNKTVLLQGEELARARQDAKYKLTKNNKSNRFKPGKKGPNMTKPVNKYGKRVKPEKMSDMMD